MDEHDQRASLPVSAGVKAATRAASLGTGEDRALEVEYVTCGEVLPGPALLEGVEVRGDGAADEYGTVEETGRLKMLRSDVAARNCKSVRAGFSGQSPFTSAEGKAESGSVGMIGCAGRFVCQWSQSYSEDA